MCTIACSDVLEPANPWNQHQCCSPMKTTSIFASKMCKFKKVAYLQLRLPHSIALATTQNVTGDHAWHFYTHSMYNSVSLADLTNGRIVGMIRTKWGITFWDALRVERCPPFLPKWWDVSGQLWKKYNSTVTAVCQRMVKNLWHSYCEGCRQWFHKSCQQIPDVILTVTTNRAGFVITASSNLRTNLSLKVMYFQYYY